MKEDEIATQVGELSVEELKGIVAETVKEVLEDWLEDFEALLSRSYLSSIEEAREDYREGRVKDLEEVLR